MSILVLDKDGWPVEGIDGHPFISFLRRLIHGRKWVNKEAWFIQRRIEIMADCSVGRRSNQ